MVTQAQRDKHWQDRRKRLKAFVDASPKMDVKFIKDLGPFKKGETHTVTGAAGNDYINRGFAEQA